MRARRSVVVLLAGAAAAASVLALGGGGATARTPTPKLVKVYDDYFTPVNVKVVQNGTVKWKWTPVFNNHNVKLTKAPVGVTKSNFWSQTSSSPTYTFTRKFTKLGKYHFICSVHPVAMQMDVTVHK